MNEYQKFKKDVNDFLENINEEVPQLEWGGIGGVGKHAEDLVAELINTRKAISINEEPHQLEWGGIGGVGKHANNLMPETENIK